MKAKKRYEPPIAYVIDVEDDDIMLGASAASFNDEKDGFSDEDQHSATDWFNDNAGDGFDDNTSTTTENFKGETIIDWI